MCSRHVTPPFIRYLAIGRYIQFQISKLLLHKTIKYTALGSRLGIIWYISYYVSLEVTSHSVVLTLKKKIQALSDTCKITSTHLDFFGDGFNWARKSI